MSARKTPVLLRRAPLSGGISALTNYRWKNDGAILQAATGGKHDVTADFDAIVCELLLDPAPDALVVLGSLILDASYGSVSIDETERAQLTAFHEAIVAIVERHNAGPHVNREQAA